MNNFESLCNTRRSIRNISNKEIAEYDLQKILEVINTAPSAGNLQGYEVIVVKNEEVKKQICAASYNQSFVYDAPVVLVFIALPKVSGSKYNARGEKLYSIQDATIACTYAMLASESLGLATTWVGAFSEEDVIKSLKLTRYEVPVSILPIGYKLKDNPIPRRRKDLAEIVRFI